MFKLFNFDGDSLDFSILAALKKGSFKTFSVLFLLAGLLVGMAADINAQRRTEVIKSKAQVLSEKTQVDSPSSTVDPPIVIEGNVKCSDLNASTNPRLQHITTNDEFKLNFADPNGTFAFDHDPSRSVTISSASHVMPNNEAIVFSWTSQIAITALIVKVGSVSYIYPYDPFAFGDSNLNTHDHQGISHISFCYGDTLSPSAADSNVQGRVVSAGGNGIGGARLTITNAATLEVTTALTNPFGFYTFEGLESGSIYFISVNHRRFTFNENTKLLTVNDSLSGVNFISNQ
ncbi:MAG: carboxypeptidase-like regulatory domain-containing protein [Acidobacteriota bacterium]